MRNGHDRYRGLVNIGGLGDDLRQYHKEAKDDDY
jgi:hypothetical protein